MSQMIYAQYSGGITVQFEWLEPKKGKLSWTKTTDGVDQQYYIQLQTYNGMGISWISDPFPEGQLSIIIDDEESGDLFGNQNADGPFPGWSTYPDGSFTAYVSGVTQGKLGTTIGKPQLVAPTTRELTFKSIFMGEIYDFSTTMIHDYTNTVADALNIPRSDVSYLTSNEIEGSKVEVVTALEVDIAYADAVEANGGWESMDVWRTICRGGNFTT